MNVDFGMGSETQCLVDAGEWLSENFVTLLGDPSEQPLVP